MKYMLHHFRDENLKVIDDLWSATIYDREQYYSATIYDREQYTLEIISFNLQNLKLEGESDSIHGRDSGKGYYKSKRISLHIFNNNSPYT